MERHVLAISVCGRYLVTPGGDPSRVGYPRILLGYPTLVLTVAAFALIVLLAVAACELTRSQFTRRLADPRVTPLSATRTSREDRP